jgi:methionyl aminopeptidase
VAIKRKSKREIELMRQAGAVVREVLDRLAEIVAPGVTTAALDAEAERMTDRLGADSLFKGVPGRGGPFPGTICASINEEVVHGIPSSDRVIGAGDVVSIDYGCRVAGYCGDAATTFVMPEAPGKVRELVSATWRVLEMAIEMSRPGVKWSAVASEMQRYAEGLGFGVVRKFVGHGIGKDMWEDPKVPNFVSPELLARDIMLEEGLVIAVEPMINLGAADVVMQSDGWTVVTKDGGPSAHFEHTLAVTADGVDVLTGPAGGTQVRS